MCFDDYITGDLIEFKRRMSYSDDEFISFGILLGFQNDLTPSNMTNYIRVHMLELGGKISSVIFWTEKDTITKI